MNMHKQYSCNEENEQQRKRSAFDIAQKYTGMSNTWQKYTIYFIKKKCIKKKRRRQSYQEKNSSLKEWISFSRRHLDRNSLDIICLTNDLCNTTHWWRW